MGHNLQAETRGWAWIVSSWYEWTSFGKKAILAMVFSTTSELGQNSHCKISKGVESDDFPRCNLMGNGSMIWVPLKGEPSLLNRGCFGSTIGALNLCFGLILGTSILPSCWHILICRPYARCFLMLVGVKWLTTSLLKSWTRLLCIGGRILRSGLQGARL